MHLQLHFLGVYSFLMYKKEQNVCNCLFNLETHKSISGTPQCSHMCPKTELSSCHSCLSLNLHDAPYASVLLDPAIWAHVNQMSFAIQNSQMSPLTLLQLEDFTPPMLLMNAFAVEWSN